MVRVSVFITLFFVLFCTISTSKYKHFPNSGHNLENYCCALLIVYGSKLRLRKKRGLVKGHAEGQDIHDPKPTLGVFCSSSPLPATQKWGLCILQLSRWAQNTLQIRAPEKSGWPQGWAWKSWPHICNSGMFLLPGSGKR